MTNGETKQSKCFHVGYILNDTKTKTTGLDDIVELIVSEIKTLENTGVNIGNGDILKGTLVCFTFDNLGGNALFGFVESFKAKYWCRMCEISKEDSAKMFVEDPSLMRQIIDYNIQLSQIENGDEQQHVFGVKRHCLLNDINNFHILQNKTVDLMHDVLEGVIPNLLRNLFPHCIAKTAMSKYSLESRVRDFNYGVMNRRNKPSYLNLSKRNLNQNASQTYCLFLHIPFVLFEFKNELADV